MKINHSLIILFTSTLFAQVSLSDVREISNEQLEVLRQELSNQGSQIDVPDPELKDNELTAVDVTGLDEQVIENNFFGYDYFQKDISFFDNIPRYDLPIFGTELEISQIVVKPEVSDDDKKKIVDRLESIRNDVVVNGSSFATKAILYSQDPGTRPMGGKLTLDRKRPRTVKEFRDTAYLSLIHI